MEINGKMSTFNIYNMIIYKITNNINGKIYIGQTTESLDKRWRRHISQSQIKKKSMYISRSISNHGQENFTIEEIYSCSTIDELNEKEIYYINFFNSLSPNGYNLVIGGKNSKMSEESKLKTSIAHRKRWDDGKRISEETREKLSKSHKGWIPSEETREKWRKAFGGKKPSENTRLGAIHHNQKTYTLTNPNGELITFTNMKKFCKENKLSNAHLCDVASGKRNSHRGWKKPQS